MIKSFVIQIVIVFLSIFIFFSCVSSEVEIEGVLKGFITDAKTQHLIEGVNVYLTPGNNSTISNSNGEYSFSGIEMGNKNVLFDKKGYLSQTSSVTIAAGKTAILNISLAPVVVPTVNTLDAKGIETTSATIEGEIALDGGAEILECGFYYGTTESTNQKHSLPNTSNRMSLVLTNLKDGTMYYYKAYARNESGESTGDVKSFTTVSVENVGIDTYEATDVSYTKATLNGAIRDLGNGTIKSCGFYFGEDYELLLSDKNRN